MKRIFVTGISTEVGKTVASAVLVEALNADYWKPVQAGDLDNTDSDKVRGWISNSKSVIHPSTYELTAPMSPHAAAELDGIRIEPEHIKEPQTTNHLVIEGAGGLLVPLNDRDTIEDLIKPEYTVILVSRHYLGSINHTLLSIERLIQRNTNIHLLFNGAENPSTESVVLEKSGINCLGRLSMETTIDQDMIRRNANLLGPVLRAL